MAKILIAYYSLAGETFAPGNKIVNLEVGHTAQMAQFIHDAIGGTLFELETITPYSPKHTDMIREAKAEYEAGICPELKSYPDIEGYDAIFVGFPNWFGTIPMPAVSFFKHYDWSGKHVILFGTSGGGKFYRVQDDLLKYCPGAQLEPIMNIPGDEVDSSKEKIEAWAKETLEAI